MSTAKELPAIFLVVHSICEQVLVVRGSVPQSLVTEVQPLRVIHRSHDPVREEGSDRPVVRRKEGHGSSQVGGAASLTQAVPVIDPAFRDIARQPVPRHSHAGLKSTDSTDQRLQVIVLFLQRGAQVLENGPKVLVNTGCVFESRAYVPFNRIVAPSCIPPVPHR